MGRREDVMKYFNEQREAFDARVEAGIEQYRKGDATLTVTDAPAGTTVEVEQLTHAFRFGANIFMLEEMETEEKNALYKERFAELLNLATVPFYWRDLELEEGKPRFAVDSPKVYTMANKHGELIGSSLFVLKAVLTPSVVIERELNIQEKRDEKHLRGHLPVLQRNQAQGTAHGSAR